MSSHTSYALNSPIKRDLYVPGEDEIPFSSVSPPKPMETDQSHRNFQWLFHKPQKNAIFPIESIAAKTNKKTLATK